MRDRGLTIEHVDHDSIADEMDLQPGDMVLEINGNQISDILDFQYLTAEENMQLLVQKKDGEHWLLEIEKDFNENLGLEFLDGGWGRTRKCSNKCIFCFVDQMPQLLRSTLYVKDDDYRLSFAQGNFITLSNVEPAELERIVKLRMSPLYISVHTTNANLRQEMMGQPRAGLIMEQLRYLANAGIQMHTQAVLCPGINDGEELARTIIDLSGLWPAVQSLAVVPVGLTKQRKDLYKLRTFGVSEARAVVEEVHRWQNLFQAQHDYPLVFASDEFYLLSGAPIPEAQKYGGFPQTENGVGLVRLFMDEWNQIQKSLPVQAKQPVRCSLVTGTLSGFAIKHMVELLNKISDVHLTLHVLENNFFGNTVTVAGLLTGQDLLEGLSGKDLGDSLFIPAVMLREGEHVFLDDLTVDDLSQQLQVPITPVKGPQDLADKLGLLP